MRLAMVSAAIGTAVAILLCGESCSNKTGCEVAPCDGVQPVDLGFYCESLQTMYATVARATVAGPCTAQISGIPC
jgi:hypothetical protein